MYRNALGIVLFLCIVYNGVVRLHVLIFMMEEDMNPISGVNYIDFAQISTPSLEVEESSQSCEGTKGKQFYLSKIDDKLFERMKGKSFKENDVLSREDLRYIHVLHVDANGVEHEGEMVCNKYIAGQLIEIFRKLYEAKYPIERMVLVDDYDAVDEDSMRANNSSCFNFRFISGTKRVSKHGLGLAVDINTLYNPYVKQVDGKTHIEPATAESYADRGQIFPYKIEKDDLCYKLFIEAGFEWGGEWKTLKDYQHFEIPTDKIKELYPSMYK